MVEYDTEDPCLGRCGRAWHCRYVLGKLWHFIILLGRCGRVCCCRSQRYVVVEYVIKIHTGDLAVDYGDVDLYLVGCDKVWRFISLLLTL